VRRLVRPGAIVRLTVTDLPFLQLGDLFLLLVEDLLGHLAELFVRAVLELRSSKEDQILVVGDDKRSEILVGIASELHVLKAVIHDLADALIGSRRPLGRLCLGEVTWADGNDGQQCRDGCKGGGHAFHGCFS
jgi:hypothetical protein